MAIFECPISQSDEPWEEGRFSGQGCGTCMACFLILLELSQRERQPIPRYGVVESVGNEVPVRLNGISVLSRITQLLSLDKVPEVAKVEGAEMLFVKRVATSPEMFVVI
jgi:hypothetical protein